MANLLYALLLVSGWGATQPAPARDDGAFQVTAPAEKKPEAAPKPAPAASCRLLTTEGPRGGRLEVEGVGFGKAPLVRIAGKITRLIERTETKIAVQIPRDSDGGAVTVKVADLEIACGTLTIIGRN